MTNSDISKNAYELNTDPFDWGNGHYVVEANVLGACMLDPEGASDCINVGLRAAEFLKPAHQRIWRAVQVCYQKSGESDPMAVGAILEQDPYGLDEAGGYEYLVLLMEDCVTAKGVSAHARRIKDQAARRLLTAHCRNVARQGLDGVSLEKMQAMLVQAADGSTTPTTKPWECFSLDDYLAQQTSPWAVHGLFRAMQVVLLGSFPSVGKSTIASGWIHATLTGTQWCGRRTRQGSVIALIGEGRKGFCLRLDAERKRSGTPIPSCEYLELVKFETPLSSPEGQMHMRALVAEQVAKHGKNPALVVIDTLSSHWSADEDSQESIAPFMRCVSTIAEEFDCAVVICHHTTKSKGKYAMPELQDFRGSGAMIGAADCVVGLHATKDGGGVVAETLKTKDDEPSGPIHLVREIVPLGVDGDGDPITGALLVKAQSAGSFDETAQELKKQREAMSEMLNQCMAAMRELGGKTSSKDAVFARMTGKTSRKRAAFSQLIDQDEIRYVGPERGRTYYLTTHTECPQASTGTHTTQSSTKGGAEGRTPPPPPADASRPQKGGAEGGGPGRKGRTKEVTG